MTEQELHVVAGLGAVGRAVIDELVGRGGRLFTRPPRHTTVGRSCCRRSWTASSVARRRSAPGSYADNLYAYGPVDGPLTEDLPYRATGPNGRVRAALPEQLMAAHAAGTVRVTIGRASDYYGPRGRQSTAGERLFVPALTGRPAQVLGNPDLPHTLTYLPDFARGLVTLGLNDPALAQVWHLPSAEAVTTREFARLVFEAAGRPLRLQVLPSPLLAGLAVVNPMLRAVREQQYQRVAPWVVDHAKFERAFGADVTPHREAIATTLDWFAKAG
jgi:nucleoside-diphosphate-sugar epimerase